jgi:hypothetical protein
VQLLLEAKTKGCLKTMNKRIYVCEDPVCGTKITFETKQSMASSIGCICGASALWIGSLA